MKRDLNDWRNGERVNGIDTGQARGVGGAQPVDMTVSGGSMDPDIFGTSHLSYPQITNQKQLDIIKQQVQTGSTFLGISNVQMTQSGGGADGNYPVINQYAVGPDIATNLVTNSQVSQIPPSSSGMGGGYPVIAQYGVGLNQNNGNNKDFVMHIPLTDQFGNPLETTTPSQWMPFTPRWSTTTELVDVGPPILNGGIKKQFSNGGVSQNGLPYAVIGGIYGAGSAAQVVPPQPPSPPIQPLVQNPYSGGVAMATQFPSVTPAYTYPPQGPSPTNGAYTGGQPLIAPTYNNSPLNVGGNNGPQQLFAQSNVPTSYTYAPPVTPNSNGYTGGQPLPPPVGNPGYQTSPTNGNPSGSALVSSNREFNQPLRITTSPDCSTATVPSPGPQPPITVDIIRPVRRFVAAAPQITPICARAIINAKLDGSTPPGSLIGTVTAEDPANNTLLWSVERDGTGVFSVNKFTGDFTLTGSLNDINSATVILRATNPAGLFCQTLIDVTVSRMDRRSLANGGAQSWFSQDVYNVTIMCSLPKGTLIMQAVARPPGGGEVLLGYRLEGTTEFAVNGSGFIAIDGLNFGKGTGSVRTFRIFAADHQGRFRQPRGCERVINIYSHQIMT